LEPVDTEILLGPPAWRRSRSRPRHAARGGRLRYVRLGSPRRCLVYRQTRL